MEKNSEVANESHEHPLNDINDNNEHQIVYSDRQKICTCAVHDAIHNFRELKQNHTNTRINKMK